MCGFERDKTDGNRDVVWAGLTEVNGLDATRQRSELYPDAGPGDETHVGGELNRERHGVWINGFN